MKVIPFPEKGDAVVGGGTIIRDGASGEPLYYEDRQTWQITYKGEAGGVFYDVEVQWNYSKTAWEEV